MNRLTAPPSIRLFILFPRLSDSVFSPAAPPTRARPFDATAFESTSESKTHQPLIVIIIVIIIIQRIMPGCNDEPLVCLC